MTGHIKFSKLDNINCVTFSKKIIKIIREKVGYKNLIITDDISMKALKLPLVDSVIKSLDSGCNIILHCNGNLSEMIKVAENSPYINNFIIKKTSQLIKIIS